MKKLLKYKEFLSEKAQTAVAPNTTTTTPPPATAPATDNKTPDGPASPNRPTTPSSAQPKANTEGFQKGEKTENNAARKSIEEMVDPGKLKKVSSEIDHDLNELVATTVKQNEAVGIIAAGIALAFPKFLDVFGNFLQKIRNWVRELFGKEKLEDKNAITKFGEWLHKKMMGGLTSIVKAIAKMFKIELKDKTAEHIAHAMMWMAIAFLCAGGLAGVAHAIKGLEFGVLITELIPTITKAYEIVLAGMAIILFIKYKDHIKDGIKHLLHYIEELYEDEGIKKFTGIKEHVIKKYNVPTGAPKEQEQPPQEGNKPEQQQRPATA